LPSDLSRGSDARYRFRRPTADDAAMILGWRTRPDVTRFMYSDIEDPDLDHQLVWINLMGKREDYRHFVVEQDDRPIGYLSYSDIDRRNRRCSSGFYLVDSDDRRRFAANLAGAYIFDYCFHALGMRKLVNGFMEGNERLVRVQRLIGFRDVGVLRRHIWKYGRWHDVYVLELLKEDYDAQPRRISLERTRVAFDSWE